MFHSPKRAVLSPRATLLLIAAYAFFHTPAHLARGKTFCLTSTTTTTPTTKSSTAETERNETRIAIPALEEETGPHRLETNSEEVTGAARRAAFVDAHFSKNAKQLRRRRRLRKMGMRGVVWYRCVVCAIWAFVNCAATLAWVASIGGAVYVADRMYQKGEGCATVAGGKCYMAKTEVTGDHAVHHMPIGDPVPFPVLYQNTVDWNLAGTIVMMIGFLGSLKKPKQENSETGIGRYTPYEEEKPNPVHGIIVLGAWVGFWCKIFAVDMHIMAKDGCPDWITELCTWDLWLTVGTWVLFPFAFGLLQIFFRCLTLTEDLDRSVMVEGLDEAIGAPWEHEVQVFFLDGEKRVLHIEKYWRKGVTADDVKAALLQQYRQELGGKSNKSGTQLKEKDEKQAKDMVARTVLFMSSAGEEELSGDAIVSEPPRIKPIADSGTGWCALRGRMCDAGRLLPPYLRFFPAQNRRRPRAEQEATSDDLPADALERGAVAVSGGKKEAVVFALMKVSEGEAV